MTRYGIFYAFDECLKLAIKRTKPGTEDYQGDLDDEGPCSLDHLVSMLSRMRTALILPAFRLPEEAMYTDEMNRWLGYLQGVLVSHGIISLENAKEINRKHKDDIHAF